MTNPKKIPSSPKGLFEAYTKAVNQGDIDTVKLCLEAIKPGDWEAVLPKMMGHLVNRLHEEDHEREFQSACIGLTMGALASHSPDTARSAAQAHLYAVVSTGFVERVEHLLRHGALLSDFKEMPGCLHQAVISLDFPMVEFLLKGGADLNVNSGFFPIWFSAMKEPTPDMLNFLFERGADIHAVSPDTGFTALHHWVRLARHANLFVIDFLVERGIDRYARNKSGQTAEELASVELSDWVSDKIGSVFACHQASAMEKSTPKVHGVQSPRRM